MKIFQRFTTELDAGGGKISDGLSEVDLSSPEDVKALIPDDHGEMLVHFGDTDFLDRYQKYKDHLAEWRTQYPKLAAVDMRYDRQAVLDEPLANELPVGANGDEVDFVDVGIPGGVRFWAFNVADSSIVVGIFLVTFLLWQEERKTAARAA